MNTNSDKKVALITGASRGIGRAVAKRLAQEDMHIAINYCRSPKYAEEVCEEIIAQGGSAQAFAGDVSQASAVNDMIAAISDQWGSIDVLVNNAGVLRDNYLMMMSDDQWDEVINTNLRGTFLTTRAVVKGMMMKRAGSIINMVSISGLIGTPGQANYAASKGAVISMTRSLAKELSRYKITVNAIAPGFVETEMIEDMNEKIIKEHIKNIPMGRIGKPEEIAELAAFLSSEKNSYITGQTIAIDGGLSV